MIDGSAMAGFLIGGVATDQMVVAAGPAFAHGDDEFTGYPDQQSLVRVPGRRRA
jgi:hypothetical protein